MILADSCLACSCTSLRHSFTTLVSSSRFALFSFLSIQASHSSQLHRSQDGSKIQKFVLQDYRLVEAQLLSVACVFASVEHWYLSVFAKSRRNEMETTTSDTNDGKTGARSLSENNPEAQVRSEGSSTQHTFEALESSLAFLSTLCGCEDLHAASKSQIMQIRSVKEQIMSPLTGVSLIPASRPETSNLGQGRESCNRVLNLEPNHCASDVREGETKNESWSFLSMYILCVRHNLQNLSPFHPRCLTYFALLLL
jgi:hypothetical protein